VKTIKINEKGAGKWADPDPREPQIEVKAGDEVVVSDGLAEFIRDHGCGEIIETESAEENQEENTSDQAEAGEDNVIKTGIEDKSEAEQEPAAEDKSKAEKKSGRNKKDK